jgi:hypothetical protein
MKNYASITKGLSKLRNNLLAHVATQDKRIVANEKRIVRLNQDSDEAEIEVLRSNKTATQLAALLGE